jgi:uncharacterized protein YoxC
MGALNQAEFRELEKLSSAMNDISKTLKETLRSFETRKTQELQRADKSVDELKHISASVKSLAEEVKSISKSVAAIASDVSEMKRK